MGQRQILTALSRVQPPYLLFIGHERHRAAISALVLLCMDGGFSS